MNWRGIRSRPGRGSPIYAVGDQLAVVGGNFLLGIAVARHSSLEGFAGFSLFHAFVVLLNFLHTPTINDALVLREASGKNTAFTGVLMSTAWLFIPCAILGSAVLAVSGVASGADAILLLMPAAVVSSLCWSARSALHSRGDHRSAFMVSMAASVTLLAAFVGLSANGVEPFRAAAMAMAMAGLMGVAVAVFLEDGSAGGFLPLRGLVIQALPGVAVAGLVWLAGNASMLFLGFMDRSDDIAGLRSVLTLLLPVNQVLIGFSAFLLPRVARLHQQQGGTGTRHSMRRLLAVCLVSSAAFALLVYPLAGYLLERIYGSEYRKFEGWMQLGALLLPMCWALVTLRRTWLRGAGQLRSLLVINVLALLIGLPVSFLILQSTAGNAVMTSFVAIQVAMVLAYLLLGRHRSVD